VALHREKREGEFVRAMIAADMVSAVHDVSDGGLLVAIAEMAMASGIGVSLEPPHGLAAHGWWFGEDQGRYVLAVPPSLLAELLETARRSEVAARVIGTTGGDALTLQGGGAISVAELVRINEAWLPALMSAPDSNM
jgi:phosphoribosylformylglycinamidine synthase